MTPENILSASNTFALSFMIVAFTHGEDACSAVLTKDMGLPGMQANLGGCGTAVVLVNELASSRINVSGFISDFNFYSKNSTLTTASGGNIILTSNGSFFIDDIFKQIEKITQMATSQLTFSMVVQIESAIEDGKFDTILSKPLIFHHTDLGTKTKSKNTKYIYNMNFVADFNTTAQTFNHSFLRRSTVTHSSGSGDRAIIPNDKGINFSAQSKHAAYLFDRENRLEQYKPMVNIDDLASGLNKSLQDNTKKYQLQYQNWLGIINDGWNKRITDVVHTDIRDDIPIVYEYFIDEPYKNFIVNNRHLQFEQASKTQTDYGVRSLTFNDRDTFYDAYEVFFSLSTDMANHIKDGGFPKMCAPFIRMCDSKSHIKLITKKSHIPHNEIGVKDTGVGAENNLTQLEFFFSSPIRNSDLTAYKIFYDFDIRLGFPDVEGESDETKINLGYREDVTVERGTGVKYWNTFFSGNHVSGDVKFFSLESPNSGAIVGTACTTHVNQQNSSIIIETVGDLNLFNDICRNPLAVRNLSADSPKMYAFPEFSPMYAKIYSKIKPDGEPLPTENQIYKTGKTMEDEYYYVGYYHVTRVTHIFEKNTFKQQLTLARTDERL